MSLYVDKFELDSQEILIKDTELTNAVTNLEEEIENSKLTELVVFGDSWARSSLTWQGELASKLNLTLHNYGLGGATMTDDRPEGCLAEQINTFLADNTFNHNKVKYFIIVGGLNDKARSVTQANLYTAIKNNLDNLKSLFPYAELLYVSNSSYPFTKDQSDYWIGLHRRLSSSCYRTLNTDVLFGHPLYDTDFSHLTNLGFLIMATKILTALLGGEITKYIDAYTFTSDGASVGVVFTRTDTEAVIDLEFTIPSGSTSFTIPTNLEYDLPYTDTSNGINGGVTRAATPYIINVNARNIVLSLSSALTSTTYIKHSIRKRIG